MSKYKNEQENGSKVKLYKTKHGWFSALTRFFKLFSFRSKKEVKPTNFNDLDSLKDKHDSAMPDAYKKGAATMATLLGAGVIGTTSPTEAHAATTTVDQNSHVVGSGSTSTSTSTSQVTGSTSTSTSTASGSTSTSTISSTSNSTSTTTSTTRSTSTSQSTGSTSVSTSTSIASGSTSISTSNSTSFASASTSISNSTLSGLDNNTVANSVTQNLETTTNTANLTNAAILTNLLKANFVQANAESTAKVSNGTEFQNALNNSDISVIQLTADIDLGQSGMGNLQIPPRDLTIDGAGHSLNLGDNCIWLNASAGMKTTTTVKDLNLYTANERGGFALTWTGAETLIYDNVHATGGAAVFADTFAPSGNLKTFEIQGHTTIDGVSSYQYNGNTYSTSSANFVGYGTLMYAGNDLIIDDNASLVVNNSMSPYDVAMLANNGEHAVKVGENATLTINNTYNYSGGQIWNNVGNIALTNQDGKFIAGVNSHINLSTSGTNVYFANGCNNNTVNFEQRTNTTFSGNLNFYFGGSGNTVNINDPAHVILNTTTSTTFSTNSSNVTINANNTNVIVTHNGVTTESNYFANNQSTVNDTTYTVGTTTGEQNNGNASVKNVMADINKTGTTRVEYTSGSEHSESISASASTSTSTQESISGSISHSIETSISESRSGSVSLSESASNSTSLSESRSGSVSLSESMSNSVSMSESMSNLVSMSESMSNSVSMSESLSNSVSMSESLSNSVSMSESLSNSVSMSESLSNSVSMS
ncbi:serine-rich glycoprotein adhesin, partial [Limosilactobacillus reuteri]|uniref:serine-rich glycoprotein adhesin n=1 Tax=Limosilactobacillus reuteri TaxID=1598 RepID=UPI0003775ECE